MIHSPGYKVHIKRSAEREMDRLPEGTFDRMARAILNLEVEPRPAGCKKLRGVNEYRIRVGDYRILFTLDDATRTVEVVAVGHRRNVYR